MDIEVGSDCPGKPPQRFKAGSWLSEVPEQPEKPE